MYLSPFWQVFMPHKISTIRKKMNLCLWCTMFSHRLSYEIAHLSKYKCMLLHVSVPTVSIKWRQMHLVGCNIRRFGWRQQNQRGERATSQSKQATDCQNRDKVRWFLLSFSFFFEYYSVKHWQVQVFNLNALLPILNHSSLTLPNLKRV